MGCSSFIKGFLTGCVYHTREQPVSYNLGGMFPSFVFHRTEGGNTLAAIHKQACSGGDGKKNRYQDGEIL